MITTICRTKADMVSLHGLAKFVLGTNVGVGHFNRIIKHQVDECERGFIIVRHPEDPPFDGISRATKAPSLVSSIRGSFMVKDIAEFKEHNVRVIIFQLRIDDDYRPATEYTPDYPWIRVEYLDKRPCISLIPPELLIAPALLDMEKTQ